jgi:hypothetical protein
MSRKIDEGMLSAFAGNMAAYIAGRALASNSDKIKKAIGLDTDDFDDIDSEIAALEKQEKKLQTAIEKRIADMSPERRAKFIAIQKKTGNIK